MHEVLRALVIDTDSDHNTQETAKRVAKMFIDEVFRGRYVPMPSVTEFPNVERLNELMIVGPITVRSACSHHLCPILGKVWIGILPNEHSQPDRPVQVRAHLRLDHEPAADPGRGGDACWPTSCRTACKPDGLAIVMEADHFCMHWRGVKDDESAMTNSVMRGAFLKDANLRREFLSLLPRKNDLKETDDAGPTAVCQPRGRRVDAGRAAARSCASPRPTTRRIGITGVLCFSDDIFLQVLEGGRSAVNALYNRIAADPRHNDVVLLSYEEIGERRFAGWSMGQVNMARLNPSLLLKYSETAQLDPYAVSGSVAMALLEELVATASIVGQP